jgi:hypothetical protein
MMNVPKVLELRDVFRKCLLVRRVTFSNVTLRYTCPGGRCQGRAHSTRKK